MEPKKTSKANLESKKGLFFQIGIITTLLALLAAFNWKSYERETFEAQIRESGIEMLPDIIQTKDVTPPEPPKVNIKVNMEEVAVVDNNKKIDLEVKTLTEDNIKEILEGFEPVIPTITEAIDPDEDKIWILPEIEPAFPGGYEGLMRYLAGNIKYPQLAREINIQGTVYLTFIVERDGRVSNVQVLRGLGGGCTEVALRVVENMPAWEPGMQGGKTVRVQYNLPIVFKLQ